ncbi:hypothetical protein ASPACDRAFT_123943 [Aspergillus aculeatus ATCC 16872]|uniref:Thioesterase domain-containing protein n=1 Tax=Aspergillus aculeatus (strain ATCC 16872 / CBS 172.66 / WB 5094) TaxID=690307 RepID=A0A1L9WLV3_ASPA1|nr:uncharacterized protein ASPACDRAFT_123943 [Aspergillus aculeatus ATCC 16872]OJJ97138.1 hypothetical protein ASPACDRAFT_123943 [Aspergillus aculeatus ATCC 16872]
MPPTTTNTTAAKKRRTRSDYLFHQTHQTRCVSFPDTLELGLRVNKLGRSSVTYEVGVFRRGEAAVKVVGGYTHVFVARETMRPTAGGMDPVVRRGLERLLIRNDEDGESGQEGKKGTGQQQQQQQAGEKARL